MAKITIAHFRKFYKEFIDEKISMSRMVEKLQTIKVFVKDVANR